MDDFVPPSYMPLADLVEKTGTALFQRAWIDVSRATANNALAAEHQRRQADVLRAKIATGKADSASVDTLQQRYQAARSSAAAARETGRKAAAMRGEVITVLRTVLCGGGVPSAILTSDGYLAHLPSYFWQGEAAIPAFRSGEATNWQRLGLQAFRYVGRVLIKRAEAERWLAGHDLVAAGIPVEKASAPPIARARANRRRRPPKPYKDAAIADAIQFLDEEGALPQADVVRRLRAFCIQEDQNGGPVDSTLKEWAKQASLPSKDDAWRATGAEITCRPIYRPRYRPITAFIGLSEAFARAKFPTSSTDAGTTPMQTTASIAEDRLVGAEAIARFRGEPIRRTRYLIQRGELPVGREGSLIVASKRALLEHWTRLTGAADPTKAA